MQPSFCDTEDIIPTEEIQMATKFTPNSMAKMGNLFESRTEDQLFEFEDKLRDECERAGVLDVALTEGLTMNQWVIVRTPADQLRELVLAAGKN